jgi:HK97 family phage prohead protease
MPAIPPHHGPTDDSPWDGPAMEARLPNPLPKGVGARAYAWQAPGTDGTQKSHFKFIHAFVSTASGQPGAASTLACSTGIAVLNGARNGTTIPDADRQGVWLHLATHLEDAGVKPGNIPKLRSASAANTYTNTLCPTCEGKGSVDGSVCPDCDGVGTAPIGQFAESNAANRAALYGGGFGGTELRTARESRCVREQDPNFRTAHRFEMRTSTGAGGEILQFLGYASVVEHDYDVADMFGPYTERIARTAFVKTLKDGADVNFLANHDGITMARTKSGTLKLSADDVGLYAEATLNPSRPDVQIVRAAVEDGDLDEMSFAFRVTRQEWDKDYTHREIQEVNMHQGDVSVVNFGANPATAGSTSVSMRSRFTARQRPTRSTRELILPNYDAAARLAFAKRQQRSVLPMPRSDSLDEAKRRYAMARAVGRTVRAAR